MTQPTTGMDHLIQQLINKRWSDQQILSLLSLTIRDQMLAHIQHIRWCLANPAIAIYSTDPDVRLAAIEPRLAELRTRLEGLVN